MIDQGIKIFSYQGDSLNEFLEAAFDKLQISYPKFYKMDHMCQLGFLASEILIPGRTLTQRYAAESVAMVFANSHASLDTDIRYQESTKTIASPGLFVYTLPNIVTGEICIRQGIRGENAFFVQPRFEATFMTEYVKMVMSKNKTSACIAGWIDVMGDQHDVFLYLVEKVKESGAVQHSASTLDSLYNS